MWTDFRRGVKVYYLKGSLNSEQLYQLCKFVPKFYPLNYVMKITFWIALSMNQESLSIAVIVGKCVPSVTGEHSWTGILYGRNPVSNKFQTSLIQIKVGAVCGCLYVHEFYTVL